MRKGQGLPVNMIVLTALALLVLVVVGAFFISGFGQASSSVQVVNATQAQCQGICQELATTAFNYNYCLSSDSGNTAPTSGNTLSLTTNGVKYHNECASFGTCTVTLRTGKTCSIT